MSTATIALPHIDITGVRGIREIATANSTVTSAGRVFTTGRDALGRFAPTYQHLRLYVTPRGHWYRSDDAPDDFHNDILCRGCGHHGHFPYILDYRPCPKPPTGPDIIRTLRPSPGIELQAFDEWNRPRCQKIDTYVDVDEDYQCAMVAGHEGLCDPLPIYPDIDAHWR